MDGKTIGWSISIILLLTAIIGGTIYAFDATDDKLTYVSSTEYISGDEGQVIVKLVDFRGNPLTATCTDTIQYPNKTQFLTTTPMPPAGFGNYYHNFTLPAQDGVYTSNVNCSYGPRTIGQSKTFHVSLLNSALQTRFDALGANITSQHLQILNSINDTQENLTSLITQNYNTILTTKNNLSTQISTFQSETQDNLTSIINLINDFNTTEAQDHNQLLNLLLLINTTTKTTQTNLNTFQTQTTNNFITINTTIKDVKTDTETIINLLDNVTLNFNTTIGNLTNQISNLINTTQNNQETTQTNLTTIISLINTLNQTTTNGFNNITNTFQNFNTTVNNKLDILQNITNWTHYGVELLLIYHNISLNNINILTESNNCWVGGQWVIFAEVQNHYGATQTPTTVACNITTANWAGPYPMTWDATRTKWKYYHTCDIAGQINWTIQCNYI